MRNTKKFWLPIATMLLATGCINEVIDNPQPNQPENTTNEYYASFDIVLPTAIGTKADPKFEEGEENEYAVNNAWVYIFEGKTEEEATFLSSGEVNLVDWQDGQNDVISKSTVTVKLTNTPPKSQFNYYALVIINKPEEGLTEPSDNITFDNWNEQTLSTWGDTDSFIMTNSPYYEEKEGNKTLKYLYEVTKENITEAPKPATTPAATIFVQRMAAKVKVQNKVNNWKDIIPKGNSSDKVNLTGWALDVTNTVEYPVQNVSLILNEIKQFETGTSYSHFFTNKGNNNEISHIWWAKDPNYDTSEKEKDSFNFLTENGIFKNLSIEEPEDIDYCLENTMDFENMTQDQTTRVVFKGQYFIDNREEAKSFIVCTSNDKRITIEEEQIKENKPAGIYTLKNLIKDSELDEIKSSLGNVSEDAEIVYYKNGIVYYSAIIKHFHPSEETPWKPETDKEYSIKHTGRFGVLRNNVYEINVNSISGYGSPIIPKISNNPNDGEEEKDIYNMDVTINVLNWAKRGYDYDLK